MSSVSFKKGEIKEQVQYLKDHKELNPEDYYEELKEKAKTFCCWTKIFILFEKSKNQKIINEIFDNLIGKMTNGSEANIVRSFTKDPKLQERVNNKFPQ